MEAAKGRQKPTHGLQAYVNQIAGEQDLISRATRSAVMLTIRFLLERNQCRGRFDFLRRGWMNTASKFASVVGMCFRYEKPEPVPMRVLRSRFRVSSNPFTGPGHVSNAKLKTDRTGNSGRASERVMKEPVSDRFST